MKPISTIEEIENFITELERIDATNCHASYSYIKNILFSLKTPYPIKTLEQGVRFARCRIHLENEVFFNKIENISHRKDIMNIKEFGRANEPAQGVFYASNKQEISFIETSSVVRNNQLLPFEIITMGVWEIQEPINAAFILSNNDIKGKNEIIEKLTSGFTSNISQYDPLKTAPHLKFLDFISRCYTKDVNGDSSKYKMSCAFSNYFFAKKWIDPLDRKLKNVDAIIYPSALDPIAINIVVHPRAIDEQKLKLIAARKSTMKKIEGLHYAEGDIVECKSIDYIKGEILWQ